MLISFFKYLKKHSYKILKSLAEFFAYPLFKYFKKAYLQNLEKSSTIFLLIPFFKYLKKHTYKSQNSFFILIIIFKETIYIKTILQTISIKNDHKHKGKYIIIACIPKIIIKNFLLFFLHCI